MLNKRNDLILDQLHDQYGPVKSDLNYTNVYQLTVAVILSAQTTDVRVNLVTKQLFKQYPDLSSLAHANIDDLEALVQTLGFGRRRAEHLLGMAQTVMKQFNGEIPNTKQALITLPGIGVKTANVILSEGFNVPAIAVDTHVRRVAYRLFLTESRDVQEIERDLEQTFSKARWHEAHLRLVNFGRYVCKARQPECDGCIFNGKCRETISNK